MSVFLSLFFVLQVIIGHLSCFVNTFHFYWISIDLTFYKVYSYIFLSTVSILGNRVSPDSWSPEERRWVSWDQMFSQYTKLLCRTVVQTKPETTMDLQLMAYINVQQDTTEPGFDDKIKLEGDGRNNVTLTISTLRLNDSAVYFCAAILHSAQNHLCLIQKLLVMLQVYQ